MSYTVEMMPITELKEYANNPRINKESVEKVVLSINTVGWKVPIIVDEDNVILAGHTRLKAAQLIGLNEVPVHTALDLSESQKTAFRIMDNKSQDYSEWNDDLLREELLKLSDLDFDLNLTGFNANEIQKLTEDMLEFTEPEEIIEGNEDINFDDFQTSNIRMVNLFLTQDTEPVFQERVDALKEKWGLENTTETVFAAIERCASNESL
jgi:ParB-like chromosome segregation protein Spo0J|tara:strand:- start:2911 stop:3537 length:627 start_codon:yes stop_codon:yes gene_type:complete